MKNITSFKTLFLAAAAAVLAFSDCRKGDFDEPPTGGETVTLTPTITVAELKAMHVAGKMEVINDDEILEATVIADDRSGNFYKQLYVQDATGGMEISINSTNLYTSYPVGRKIYVKCKGLVLGDGDNTLTMGGYIFDNSLQGITQTILPKVILKSAENRPVDPAVRTIATLTPNDYGTVVTLKDVEVSKSDTGKTYADAVGKITANRQLFDCSNGKITLRSSGFATFAGEKVSSKKGTVTGILTRFGSTDQIFIRDLSDVKMDSLRCGQTTNPGGGGTGNLTAIDILDLRDNFSGSTTTAPVDKKIKGIVISDRSTNHTDSKNVIIQDGTGGIMVRFTSAHSFDLGDEIEVGVSGMELSEFSKVLQVNNVPNANAVKLASGKTVAPRVATIAEIIANHASWESTLVQITAATITGASGTLSGSTTVTDGSGTITMFTRSQTTFAASAIPSGQKKITAIVSEFTSGKQIAVRKLSDIE